MPIAAREQRNAQHVLVYKTQLADGSSLYTDQRPLNQTFELLRFDCYACKIQSTINWNNTPLFRHHFLEIIQHAAEQTQLDKALLQAVIHAESAFNPRAVSAKGATGLMQLMPLTMQSFAVTDGYDPVQNIPAGSQYLAQLLKEFNGNIVLSLAAYNAGPTAVRRYNGVPPFAETQAYIERVHILWQRYASG